MLCIPCNVYHVMYDVYCLTIQTVSRILYALLVKSLALKVNVANVLSKLGQILIFKAYSLRYHSLTRLGYNNAKLGGASSY